MMNSVMIEGFVCNMKAGVSAGGVMWTRFSIGFRRKAGSIGFINCVAYNKIADRLDRAGIKNGSNLLVAGNIRIDEYTSKEGKKTTVPGITVNDFDILFRSKKNRIVEKTEETAALDAEIEKKYDLKEPDANNWQSDVNPVKKENNDFSDSPFAPFA